MPKPSVVKIVKSEFVAFLAMTSFMSGPIFLILALSLPRLASDSQDNTGLEVMPLILAMLGIGELSVASVLLSWKLRLVNSIFERGTEVKSRVASYDKEMGTVVFEYTVLGQKHRARKHVFGRKNFPDPSVGQEVALIVHQDKPEKFVIKAQYL